MRKRADQPALRVENLVQQRIPAFQVVQPALQFVQHEMVSNGRGVHGEWDIALGSILVHNVNTGKKLQDMEKLKKNETRKDNGTIHNNKRIPA